MASKKILLTIPGPIFKILKKEMEKYAYTSTQELILEILRDKYFRQLKSKKRGRPKKMDETRLWRRKKIFDKDGERISFLT